MASSVAVVIEEHSASLTPKARPRRAPRKVPGRTLIASSSFMLIEVDRAQGWELPDDGRRFFGTEERIPIGEHPPSPPLTLPPWVTSADG